MEVRRGQGNLADRSEEQRVPEGRPEGAGDGHLTTPHTRSARQNLRRVRMRVQTCVQEWQMGREAQLVEEGNTKYTWPHGYGRASVRKRATKVSTSSWRRVTA